MQIHRTLHRARPAAVGQAANPSWIQGARVSSVAARPRHLLLRQPQIFQGPKLGPTQSTDVQALGLDTISDNRQSLTGTRSVRIHYTRSDKRYQNWGLHVWGDAKEQTDWQRPLKPSGSNEDGVWFDVPLQPRAMHLGLQIHAGESKSAYAEVKIADLEDSYEIWLKGDEPQAPRPANMPVGSLGKQAAHWVSDNVIVWRHDLTDENGPRKFHLHSHSKAYLWTNGEGVQGSEKLIELKPLANDLPDDLAEKYPYLKGCSALQLPPMAQDVVSTLLRGQLAMSVSDANGVVLDATSVQIQGALDAYYKYDGPLGTWRDPQTQKLMVSVWAPTAQTVQLLHYKQAQGGPENVLPMTLGALGAGVWSVELPDDALWTYYKYRLNVYHPESRRFEVSEAPDPYSRSLAANAERTQVVLPDLDDPKLVPEGWESHSIPGIARWTDISLYELCIRDFSSEDPTVKPEVRGKYLAFVPEVAALTPNSTTSGLAHLASLREAGMNHLHLLPTYDFGSVPERPEDQLRVTDDLSQYAPDGEEQQRAVLAVADKDAFNWGYDPVLYGVPDGSYATDPDGEPRITEFRRMVMSLHKQGWRVVLDVVYNHLYAGGPQDKSSVLDKVVPGYYTRRYEDGQPCTAACGHSTANEMYMCERLIIDDIVHWAEHYKIDGFRWDIMGHLLISTLDKIRARLDALTVEKHGVDGKSIYMYGEAWEFAEVTKNARGLNCAQANLAGTRLGSFNERMRDGALGGAPWLPWDFQGFVTGLGLAPSSCKGQGNVQDQLNELGTLTDWVQFALAGNLRQYNLEGSNGQRLNGGKTVVNDVPLGYGGHPCEHISFIGCHDQLTMFDIITEKAPITALAAERVRMQVMCLSLILMSQGIPFIHGGDDILRSKSLDRDSYNSGDWFNGVDWTAETHKLGIGLPVHTKNGEGWHYKRPLLTNPMIKPSSSMLKNTAAITRQLLRLRYSSPLFRLPSAEAICNQVFFHNTGPKSIPGVIVMELVSAGPEAKDLPFGSVDGTDVPAVYDPDYERIVVVFNASPLEKELAYPPSAKSLQLHPLQSAPDAPDARARTSKADNSARQLIVPARTAAVFVQPR